MRQQRKHSESYLPPQRSPHLTEASVAEASTSPDAPAFPAEAAAPEPLRCVWSGYPHYDRDCRSRIPASVVVKAWQREMQLNDAVEGFFNFEWRHGIWLAYGSRDGSVRGIYCPTHRSERDSRDVRVQDRRPEQAGEVAMHKLGDQRAGAALQ
jgi:hypothetical protein